MRFQQGDSFGHYTLLAPLGHGGMGEVYRARDNRLARDVAVKFVTPTASSSTESLSLAEARAASALSHPHVCTLFAVEEVEGETFIVMATAMLAMLPPVAVIVLMQRWFVKGLVETEK